MSDDEFPDMSPAPFTPTNKRVAYFYDQDVGNYVYYLGHPMKPHRIRMAHNLIVMYGMCEDEETEADNQEEGARRMNDPIYGANGLNGHAGGSMDNSDEKYDKAVAKGARSTRMQCFRPRRANKNDMTRFHTDEYVELLEQVNPDNGESLTGGGMRCLTGDDCPPFEGVFEFCSISAGGSIAAAQKLNAGAADIAINWAGGLHHAKKTEASGFCYINDIVLGILELLRIHPRVLYIDVDVHHGDGVEEAFYTTDRVMTASFHRFGEFFPGTGDVRDVGMKRGKGYSVNVPLRDGINDQSFHSIFKPVMQHIIDWYRPGAIVLQMGADSLAGDKLGGFNLTLDGHAECARFIKSFGIPTMMLGGGGYTIKNVARAWTLETAVMCDRTLSHDLPYNQYMEYYGPRYKLEVLANNADDHNPPEYLEKIKRTVIDGLKDLPFAPSMPIKSIPSKSLGERLGLGLAELNDPEDDVEAKVKRLLRRRNGYASSGSSDDESEDVPSAPRSRRQGGQGSRAPPTARRRDTDMSVDDDPCRVKKRTFFSSSGQSKSKSRSSGINGNINGRIKDQVSMTMGLGGIQEWSLGMSASVVVSPSRQASPSSQV